MQVQAQELLAVVSTFKLAPGEVAYRPGMEGAAARALSYVLPATAS